MEEFLELSYWVSVSWHETVLGVYFQIGLDEDMILCDLFKCEFPLVVLINLILYLNGSNFEVEEMEENLNHPHPAPSETHCVSPACPMPGPSTYLITNGSNHPSPPLWPQAPSKVDSGLVSAHIHIHFPVSSSEFLLSPQSKDRGLSADKPRNAVCSTVKPRNIGRSIVKPINASHSTVKPRNIGCSIVKAVSRSTVKPRNIGRSIVKAVSRSTVRPAGRSMSSLERAPDPESIAETAHVPASSPERASVPETSPEKASIPESSQRGHLSRVQPREGYFFPVHPREGYCFPVQLREGCCSYV